MRAALLLLALLACHKDAPTDDHGADTDGTGHTDAAPTCAAPRLTAPFTAPDATRILVGLRRAPNVSTAGRDELRPIVVEADGRGTITVDVDGAFLLFDERGKAITPPLTLSSDDLPTTLLVGADVPGEGTLRVTPVEADLGCFEATLALGTHGWHDLAVRALPPAPGHLVVGAFRSDEPIDVVLDAHLLPDRAGLAGDVHVVAHRLPSAWIDDPTLVDVSGGAEPVTFPAVDGTTVVRVWDAPRDAGTGHPLGYDVVVDFGRDGRLDPGDLVDGFGRDPGFWVLGDLSRPGPYTPQMQRIALASSPDLEVWWPNDVPADARPLPLVMIAHGNGHDYRWYGFLGAHLASWGFVVASHVNNTEPGIVTASTSTLNATDWMVANRETALGGALAGLVDPNRIAWIGHSRGGEGVVRAYQRLAGNTSPAAPAVAYTAADVRAIVSIGPTVFDGVFRSNPGEVPYLQLLGGADGDVTGGADCPICQSMRIAAASAGPTSIVYVHGASHNVFHDGTALAGFVDEGVGPDRLGAEVVHPAEQAWLLAWLGWHVLGNDGYGEVFTRMASDFRPDGVLATIDHAIAFRPAVRSDALVVDDFQANPEPETSSLGGAVTTTATVTEAVFDDGNAGFQWGEGDPTNGMTLVSGGDAGARGAIVAWSGDATWTVALPAPTDVRGFGWLSLVAAQTTRHPNTVAHGGPLAFAIELTDADGDVALVETDDVGVISDVYPRGGLGDGFGWTNEWNTVRVPVRAFVTAASGLDPSRITAITLHFGEAHGAATGRIGLDDLAFVR